MNKSLETTIEEHFAEDIKRFDLIDVHIREDKDWKRINTEQNQQILAKLDAIYPEIQTAMKQREFWRMFREKFKMGGNGVLWIVGVIAAAVILLGYGKIAILTWLGINGK